MACHLCEGPCEGSCTACHACRACVRHGLLAHAVCHSGLTPVSRAAHSCALPVPSVCRAASFLSQRPDSLPPHTPQCPSSRESARRQSLLATAIMSAWLWSIAVTGGLTAGTCPMSSTVVRSCWELQRGSWWPANPGFPGWVISGYKGLVQTERSEGGGDGERLMAEAAHG